MWKLNKIEWIDFEITSFCNIKCNGCWRETHRSAPDVINKEILPYKLIVERFKHEDLPNLKIINFCGSVDEPITHPDLIKILDYFLCWKIHINIATNGSLKTTKWWTRLGEKLKYNSHTVTFAIDGLEDTHHIYREGSNYNKVLNNAKAFIAAGGKASWQFIEFEHNKHQVEEAEKLSVELGFIKFRLVKSVRDKYKSPKKITNTIERSAREVSEKINCEYGGLNRVFVNHQGMLIPCCHLNSATMSYLNDREVTTPSRKLLDESQGELDLSLYYNSIGEILDGEFWTGVVESWSSDNPLPECVKNCKENNRTDFIMKVNPNVYK